MRLNCYALHTFVAVSYAFPEAVLVVMHAECDGQGNLTWLSGIIGKGKVKFTLYRLPRS
jgi:hypothetical protein